MAGALARLEHRPWPEMPGTGKALTTRKMAVLLGRFGIAPEHSREGNVYLRASFADAFARYLAPEGADEPSTLHRASVPAASGAARPFTRANGREGSGAAENPAVTRGREGLKVPPGGARLPAWTDLNAWRSRLGRAADLEAKRAETVAWVGAAGGRVDGPALALPRDLPRCLALAELRTQARLVGFRVEATP